MASAQWWVCSFSVPVLLGVRISLSVLIPSCVLLVGAWSEDLSGWQEILKQRTWLLLHGDFFLFLRITSQAVGCCDVQVFLRLREVTDGGSLPLPLAVKKFVDMDAAGVQGQV